MKQPTKPQQSESLRSLSKRIAILRILFGIIWLIDAVFKFEPAFYRGILQTIKIADSGEPSWLNPWFHTWYRVVGSNPHLFAVIIIIAESLTALSLIFGIARRLNYVLGAVLSFLIWSVAEGFGGPYVAGSTDVGAGIIYVVPFLMLLFVDKAIPVSWSLDNFIENKIAWWHRLAGPTNNT